MNSSLKSHLSEASAIALLTFIGYVVAFHYEKGFCSFWNIPSYLIEISIPSVITAVFGLFSSLIVIFLVMNLPISLLSDELDKPNSLKKRFIILNLFFGAILVGLARGYGLSVTFYAFLIFLVIIQSIFILLPWLIDRLKNPEKTGFFDRVTRNYQSTREPKSLFDRASETLGSRFYLMFVFDIVLLEM